MKVSEKQFNNAQENFVKNSLSSEQKNTMLSNIYKEHEFCKVKNKAIASPINLHSFFLRRKNIILASLMLFFISGTTYATTQSLPGDVLYGVKVNVIEPMILSLKFSEKSKNEYKALLSEKRVDEIEKLKAKYSLKNDTELEPEKNDVEPEVEKVPEEIKVNEPIKNAEVRKILDIPVDVKKDQPDNILVDVGGVSISNKTDEAASLKVKVLDHENLDNLNPVKNADIKILDDDKKLSVEVDVEETLKKVIGADKDEDKDKSKDIEIEVDAGIIDIGIKL